MQFRVTKARGHRQELIQAYKPTAVFGKSTLVVLVELILQHIHSTLDALVNQTVLFGCGALAFRIVDNACNSIHIAVIQNIVTVNLIFQFAELGNRSCVGQHRCGVERRKGFFHFLCVVHKVHDYDLFIKGRAYAVQTG